MPNTYKIFPTSHVRFWVLAFILFLALVWLLGDVLTPFVLGFAIAYFLDPVVRRIMRLGFSRTGAALLVLALFLVAVTSLILALAPVVTQQVGHLIAALPDYIDHLREKIEPLIHNVLGRLSEEEYQSLRQAAGESASKMASVAGTAFMGVLAGGKAVVGALSLFVIMPVVAFYIMNDWPTICMRIDGMLPRKAAPGIREELDKIDKVLSGFLRGQTLVCFTLAMFYATGLSLTGLNFGFVIGLLIGLFSFVPYIGAVLGFMIATAVGIGQFGFETQLFFVWAVLLTGQLLEGYVLIPRLVGHSVGLHDLWVIFAIMAGGALFGFVGILLAVPVAAILGVLIRYGVSRYKKSRYYLGGARPNKRPIRPL